MRGRSPATPIALVALAVACTGITPAEAVRAVKRAAFADNAGSVNGIKASRTPAAGRLLPLGSDGKFDSAVLPSTGIRGPRGPVGGDGRSGASGPTGPAGPRGPSDARIVAPAGVAMSRNAGVPVNVASISNAAAGNYLVMFTAEATWREANVGLYVTCETRVNGTAASSTRGIVGDHYGGSEVIADVTAINRTSAFDLSVACYPDQSTTGNPTGPAVINPKLVLVQFDRVTTG